MLGALDLCKEKELKDFLGLYLGPLEGVILGNYRELSWVVEGDYAGKVEI